MRSTVELMQILCRVYLAEALSCLSVRAKKRHIKSITVCMSINPGSRQQMVAYDIREDVCNDSCDLQWKMQEYLVILHQHFLACQPPISGGVSRSDLIIFT